MRDDGIKVDSTKLKQIYCYCLNKTGSSGQAQWLIPVIQARWRFEVGGL